MIQVEKKFLPNEEQMQALLQGADLFTETEDHDVYYDFPDYHLSLNGVQFRLRNGVYGLKINKNFGNDLGMQADEEIIGYENIRSYFETEDELASFVQKNMVEFMNFKTKRKRYKRKYFMISIDKTDFDYSYVQIETFVEKEEDVKEARESVISLAKSCGIEIKDMPTKRSFYLKSKNPELFDKIYNKN